QMNGRLFVLFVAPAGKFLSKPEALHIETCKRLCQECEGEFVRRESSDIVSTIADISAQERITQIVLGETRRSRFHLLLKGSIVQRLMRDLPQVDLHIISNN
ncbi:MAG TPA: hypothetical protein V6D20_24965, partial [Candidatus Obscuribacterales bacterium]